MRSLRFYPAGDCALVAEFGQIIDERINDQVHAKMTPEHIVELLDQLRKEEAGNE